MGGRRGLPGGGRPGGPAPLVHGASFFHRSYKYIDRQRNLARIQAKVVRELGLPKWMYLFALGRYTYAYFPTGLKRVLRRTLGGSREKDL